MEREAAAPLELTVLRARRREEVPDALLREADGVIASYLLRYDAALAARMPRCRILSRAGVGTDNVDLAAFGARGIPVCNTPDYGTGEIADTTIGMILALARGLAAYQLRFTRGEEQSWRTTPFPPTAQRLQGARLLIVGMGRVGTAVAKRAQAFDMDVGYFSARASDVPELRRYASLDEGLAAADCVTLHCALTPQTRHLIDARAIAHMKPDALLVNTARGALVDTAALIDALRSERLGGAALDVLEEEPPAADSPLRQALVQDAPWAAGRLILSPHAAWVSTPAMRDMRLGAIANARDYLLHGTLKNCVNGRWLAGGARSSSS